MSGGERHNSFHEHWYLVESLAPRLRADLQSRRQTTWGRTWHVLSDPDNNTHFRLADEAYRFVALLNGSRTIREAWELCLDRYEDEALTQGEIIALLGNLHNSNLLALSMPADTRALLERRQRQRLKKLGGTLSSFLFLRFPLWYPDAFFTRFQKAGSFIFTPAGMLVWVALLGLALRELLPQWGLFRAEARQAMAPANMLWMYAVIVLTKAVHEAGHAFACKHFSARDGRDGEVNGMGIMLLIFAPVPYIDVSSSVQIRGKWQRAMVALAGVYSELMLAFVATLVWASTPSDTTLHILAGNCMLIASVVTVLFNINPLLRFDGYFVLSDLLGMPNLYQRSQQYAVYLFKKHVLGVRSAVTVVRQSNERFVYPVYAVAAFVYRIIVTLGIFVLLQDSLYALGVVVAAALAFLWFGLPLVKGLHYMAFGPELSGCRMRTGLRLALVVGVLGALLLGIPLESALVAEGVVESRRWGVVYAEAEGVLESFAATDVRVLAGKTELAVIANPGIDAQLKDQELSADIALSRFRGARAKGDANAAGQAAREWQGASQQLSILRVQASLRTVKASMDGVWVAPELTRRHGKWVSKGDALGMLYAPDDLRLRVAVDQYDAARLFSEPIRTASFRVSGPQYGEYPARVEGSPASAGRRELFHEALASQVGGSIPVVAGDGGTAVAANRFFEVRFKPDVNATEPDGSRPILRPGQKVLVRMVLGEEPLGLQWLRRLRQFFTRR